MLIFSKSIMNSFDVFDKYRKLNLDKITVQKDAEKYFKKLGWI